MPTQKRSRSKRMVGQRVRTGAPSNSVSASAPLPIEQVGHNIAECQRQMTALLTKEAKLHEELAKVEDQKLEVKKRHQQLTVDLVKVTDLPRVDD